VLHIEEFSHYKQYYEHGWQIYA